MEIGIQMKAFDFIQCSISDITSITNVFNRCFEEYFENNVLSIFRKKKKSLMERKELLTKEEEKQIRRQRSSSLSPISESESDKEIRSYSTPLEGQKIVKLQNDVKNLYQLVEKLTKEIENQKKEIQELKNQLNHE